MKFFTKMVQKISSKNQLEIKNSLQLLGSSGYATAGASTTKRNFVKWKADSKTADEDITKNLDQLRQRSRSLYIEGGLPRGILNKLVTNVVGGGLQLNSQIDYDYLGLTRDQASELERTIEREFRLWASDKYSCDIGNSCNFYEMQSLAFLSMLMSGDCFILLPTKLRQGNVYPLKLQLLESDRITNPLVVAPDKDILEGIESDQYGAPMTYWIQQRQKDPTKMNCEFVGVAAYTKSGRQNILHLMTRERPEQRRGIPVLSGVIELVKQLTRYTGAELDAAVISAFFTVFIKRDQPEFNPEMQVDYTSSSSTADANSSQQPQAVDLALAPGAVVELNEGESIQTANPGRPNGQFDQFTTAIIRQIGVAIEVPYEVLVQHFQSSYSASRAAILQAWQMFKVRRQWLIDNFCTPVYKAWMLEAVLLGRLNLPGFLTDPLAQQAWLGANFFGSSMPEIDPTKAVTAASKRVSEGLSTREREAMELTGMNFDEIIGTRIAEEANMNKIRELTNQTITKGKNNATR